MKKLLLVLSTLFIVGCSTSSSLISRSQIRTGMIRKDVLRLYGFNIHDSNSLSFSDLPQFTQQPITESQNGDCTRTAYRYWLSDYGQEHPFLLTFESCKLPNYEAVQKEKKRRVDNFNEAAKNDPNLQREMDALCETYQLDPQDREILIELLTINTPNLLPQCMTDYTLIHIQRDENYSGARRTKTGVFESIYGFKRSILHSTGLRANAYGPGIHMNQYGQPVTLKPDWGGVPGEQLRIKQNAYGPGVHMDQYGRPVREYSLP